MRALDFLGTPALGRDQLVADAEIEERRAQLIEEADALLEGLGRGPRGRLILLNGLPGVGKSTLAREYVATRPGTLNLDIDVLRTLLGGPWEETGELGRSLALQLIRAHVESGHEVVVPQLVADPEQLGRFEEVAEDAEFVMVLVEGESRPGDQPWHEEVAPADVADYRQRLEQLVAARLGVHRVQVVEGAVTTALTDLERLLQAE